MCIVPVNDVFQLFVSVSQLRPSCSLSMPRILICVCVWGGGGGGVRGCVAWSVPLTVHIGLHCMPGKLANQVSVSESLNPHAIKSRNYMQVFLVYLYSLEYKDCHEKLASSFVNQE